MARLPRYTISMLVKTKESDPSLIDKCKFCTHTELTENQFLPLQANFPRIFSHEKKTTLNNL